MSATFSHAQFSFARAPIVKPVAVQVAGRSHTPITSGHPFSLAPSAQNPRPAGCDRMGLETPYGGDEARAADSVGLFPAIGRSSQSQPLAFEPF